MHTFYRKILSEATAPRKTRLRNLLHRQRNDDCDDYERQLPCVDCGARFDEAELTNQRCVLCESCYDVPMYGDEDESKHMSSCAKDADREASPFEDDNEKTEDDALLMLLLAWDEVSERECSPFFRPGLSRLPGLSHVRFPRLEILQRVRPLQEVRFHPPAPTRPRFHSLKPCDLPCG